MYIKIINDDNFTNYAKSENEDYVNINIKFLLRPIPYSILLLCPINLSIWTILKPLFSQQLNNG